MAMRDTAIPAQSKITSSRWPVVPFRGLGGDRRPGDAKRKLAAITSADVAGQARHKGDDERATMDALGASRDVFKAHIADHPIVA